MEDRHRELGKRTDEITEKLGGLMELEKEDSEMACYFHLSPAPPFFQSSLMRSFPNLPQPQSWLTRNVLPEHRPLELTILQGPQIPFLVLIILYVSGLIVISDLPSPIRLSAARGMISSSVVSSMPKIEPGSYQISINTLDE